MSHERIILSLQKENEELLNKNRSLKATIEKMKTELRLKITEKDTEYTILKQKYRDKCLEVENSSNNNREILKLKKKISDLKLKISRFENERRDMKDVIKQKDIEIDIERAAKKKAQISEKKIAKECEDKIITMKTEISHKINKVNQNKKILENSEKDDARYESPKANQKVSKKTCDIIFSEKKIPQTLKENKIEANSNMYKNQSVNENDSICASSKKTVKRLKSSSPPQKSVFASSKKIGRYECMIF